ncbi:membrane protein [Microtetraspora sp. NBRC 13810]|uniref:PP2C family protein-serine/threonine phosphatase n=1 Tax=Microtetraspora sp. NBRC 13810 TaxID=3030990 RepID=UPI0024A05744|nr:PP2C family protein-serine/threonine phosphatase [Microtetraspora sp. NBRC 13810]GLW08061.1 membrane protein [Microtetraspora sp. NBRC 13810]
MSALETMRSVWSPGDQAFSSATGEGQAPRSGMITLRSPGVARHRLRLTLLVLAAIAIGPLNLTLGGFWAPPILLAPVLLAGGLYLRPAALSVVITASAVSALCSLAESVHPVQLLVAAIVAFLAVRLSQTRSGVGIHGLRGTHALIELRARLRKLSQLPSLPRGWHRIAASRPAGGASFGGDFVASVLDGTRLKVALVDVSGKGDEAASEALMLAGTIGGLLGELPTGEFLATCNSVLVRDGDERLVTAVLLDLDLDTGNYVITSAGHPPPAVYRAGSMSWVPIETSGIALGVTRDAQWTSAQGALGKGDALMLVTDGLLGRSDPDLGMDRLLGTAAEMLLKQGTFEEAPAMVKKLAHTDDDSALVLIWRT